MLDEKIQRLLKKHGLATILFFHTDMGVRAEAIYMVGTPQELAALREANGDHKKAQQLSAHSFRAKTSAGALDGVAKLLENAKVAA